MERFEEVSLLGKIEETPFSFQLLQAPKKWALNLLLINVELP
jgi:hypothetical protein